MVINKILKASILLACVSLFFAAHAGEQSGKQSIEDRLRFLEENNATFIQNNEILHSDNMRLYNLLNDLQGRVETLEGSVCHSHADIDNLRFDFNKHVTRLECFDADIDNLKFDLNKNVTRLERFDNSLVGVIDKNIFAVQNGLSVHNALADIVDKNTKNGKDAQEEIKELKRSLQNQQKDINKNTSAIEKNGKRISALYIRCSDLENNIRFLEKERKNLVQRLDTVKSHTERDKIIFSYRLNGLADKVKALQSKPKKTRIHRF